MRGVWSPVRRVTRIRSRHQLQKQRYDQYHINIICKEIHKNKTNYRLQNLDLCVYFCFRPTIQVIPELLNSYRITFTTMIPFMGNYSVKAESHCSDNENDPDHDAKRTHSIGLMSVCVVCVEQFKQQDEFSLHLDRYLFRYRSVIVIVFVTAAV